MKLKALLLMGIVALAASCTSTKKVAYFQGADDQTIERNIAAYQARITPNDNLYISVSALNPDAVVMFNELNSGRAINLESLSVSGYLVDKDGNINFPVLGKVHLGGMTKTDAVEHLQRLVSEYIVSPTVNIRFLNYKVTVLGEVARPGTFTIRDERITIPEALGLAGDMTIYGRRDNLLIYREVNGEQVFHRLDMTSADVFASDFFYLQQNDVVYVQPNRARSGSSSYNQNLSLGVSFLSLLVTIINILY